MSYSLKVLQCIYGDGVGHFNVTTLLFFGIASKGTKKPINKRARENRISHDVMSMFTLKAVAVSSELWYLKVTYFHR